MFRSFLLVLALLVFSGCSRSVAEGPKPLTYAEAFKAHESEKENLETLLRRKADWEEDDRTVERQSRLLLTGDPAQDAEFKEKLAKAKEGFNSQMAELDAQIAKQEARVERSAAELKAAEQRE